VHFTPQGRLISGGTNRGWPVRGLKPFALERLEWTGKTPFEIKRIHITSTGFRIVFTKPVDPKTAAIPANYRVSSFTYPYHQGYGGPEVEQTSVKTTKVDVAKDGLSATVTLDKITPGHIHEFNLDAIRDLEGGTLVHSFAFYTVNEIPK
jgi:hypothetical protein